MNDNVDDETRNGAAEENVTEANADVSPDNAAADAASESGMSYQQAEFQSLSEENGLPLGSKSNLDLILDVPVTVSMELGRTTIPIRNLMQLTQGSVVELNRLAGEPMDVLVNGTLIAHGEVVVVNEKFGIRLTDVVSAVERVKKLG